MGFERSVGEFDIGDFAEGSLVESLVDEILDFVEIFYGFRVGLGEKFFGKKDAEIANPDGAGKTKMAREFFGNGFFATAESGAVGDVVVNQSGSLEDFVGGGEIEI